MLHADGPPLPATVHACVRASACRETPSLCPHLATSYDAVSMPLPRPTPHPGTLHPTRCPQVNDTVMLDIETGKVKDFVKFDLGNLAMCTGGHNNGRVGTIVHKEKHKGACGGCWMGRCGWRWGASRAAPSAIPCVQATPGGRVGVVGCCSLTLKPQGEQGRHSCCDFLCGLAHLNTRPERERLRRTTA